ncbi:ABC-type glycerol-3-phosphate transport system, substrate-binding protein [Cohnella sp. OV330]|uniref:ABC transporter substrate-binding protein n=1 Tax=Cohnella sp. OV330 TaxID=1855288 RepID=UPI0008ED65EB|nr:sugar ABC transporter substrate-binding protein [Cohnella sp. OV330]SFB26407.1 ABC-type glycerol-3-phosphate transport system, substrate-binding protein [Cohnella sp. OV330]
MKKTKLAAIGTSALLVTAFLAGCSTNNNANSGSPSGTASGSASASSSASASDKPASGEQVKLTFWRNSGNDAENSAYDQLVKAFNASNPDIKVEMSPIPYSDYDAKLRTSIAANNPPDIMAIDAPNMASYAQSGALQSLTDYFKADGNLDDIPAGTIGAYTYKDNIYMAPLTESSIALFYNKKMFEAAGIPLPSKNPDEPMTWDQVREAAMKLTDAKKGIYGIDPAQGFGNAGATAYFKYPIVWQFGGEIMDKDGTTSKGYLDMPETKKALQFFADLYNKDKVSALEYPPDPFPTGKLAMTVDGSWSLSFLAEKFPNFKLGEDWDIAPLPKGTKQAVANGSWSLAISSKSKNADAAWKFVNYVTGAEGSKLYSSVTKDIPVRYSVAKQFPELNEYPKNVFVIQNQKYGRSRPITPIFPQMSDAVNKMFEDVTISKRNVDTAIADAIKKIDKAYADMPK